MSLGNEGDKQDTMTLYLQSGVTKEQNTTTETRSERRGDYK